MLFDPKDQVMQQNVQYYRFYREQWGLEESDFQPRPVSHVHVCCLSGCFLMITLLCFDTTADVTMCSSGGPRVFQRDHQAEGDAGVCTELPAERGRGTSLPATLQIRFWLVNDGKRSCGNIRNALLSPPMWGGVSVSAFD